MGTSKELVFVRGFSRTDYVLAGDKQIPVPSSELSPHHRPNESRLEAFREQIAEARRLNWPYRRLQAWLSEEHQLRISAVAIRNFCLARGIRKGPALATRSNNLTTPTPKPTDPWAFNTDGPLKLGSRKPTST